MSSQVFTVVFVLSFPPLSSGVSHNCDCYGPCYEQLLSATNSNGNEAARNSSQDRNPSAGTRKYG